MSWIIKNKSLQDLFFMPTNSFKVLKAYCIWKYVTSVYDHDIATWQKK